MSGTAERAVARLLLPAVRWDPERGFHAAWPEVERALEAGVGGFILFGGEASAVRDFTDEVQRRAPHPLLIAADLERGAGQQFRGATPLPPARAIGSLDDLEVTQRAGELTAREARALGVGWVFAPVADLDIEPRNPMVSTRAFQADALRASRQVEAWVRGCAEGGALSCAKHFPGTGRAVDDAHVGRSRIDADREALEQDLLPFRSAVSAGVDGVMLAHVAFPALDPDGRPASRSAAIAGSLLRRTLRFDGLVATDAINMEGFSQGEGEEAVAEAVAAGCDVLLYPADLPATIAALAHALRKGTLEETRVRQAGELIDLAAGRVSAPMGASPGRAEDLEWAAEIAARTVRLLRGSASPRTEALELLVIEDDVGGPHAPPPRGALPAALVERGFRLEEGGQPLLAVYADVRAWKGRSGLSETAVERARDQLAVDPETIVVLFGHPRQAEQLPFARHVLCAWGGEPLMQKAAARRLSHSVRPA